MGITSALQTGVSGLVSNGEAMNVIGNNISNANTVGFKAASSLFADLLSQNAGKDSQVGSGVKLQAIRTIFSQGTSHAETNVTDLSIQGDGFFALQSPTVAATSQSAAYLSRNGAFSVNKNLELVNADGFQVLDTSGKPIVFVDSGNFPSTDFGRITSIDGNGVITYLATDGITENYYNPSNGIPGAETADLVNAAGAAAASAAADAAAASSSLLAAAALANSQQNIAAATGIPPGSNVALNNAAANSLVAVKSAFAGYLYSTAQAKAATDNAVTVCAKATGASSNPILEAVSTAIDAAQIRVNLIGGPGVGGEPAITGITVASSASDYLAAANAASADVSDPSGGLTALFTTASAAAAFAAATPAASRAVNAINEATVQRIALVRVPDPAALTKVGGSLYSSNADCGVPTAPFSLAANSPNGSSLAILSNSLEASNVDMSTEFVNMITTQRAYSANSKTITSADQMLQEVLGLIR